MAFVKTADAKVVHPHISRGGWSRIRTAGQTAQPNDLPGNLIERASSLFQSEFHPDNYLLSHATIIASVDVYAPPDVKLGSVMEDGRVINRKYPEFRVKPGCDQWLNHNLDGWSRPVLLKSYPTFIGAHNFCEHVQLEELSKGRIIDAVARDVGESIYVDILIATDRQHENLIRAIENEKMSTLSMGCFLPGTQVSMADGCRIAIEDVQPGDMVLTHKGRAREVLNKQVRRDKWGIRKIKAVGVPTVIEATDNHPFLVFRQPKFCACGCGEVLPTYKGGRKNATRALKRRFKVGHDKRILNPNGSYSLEEYKRRKARMDTIQADEGQWVRADDLRVGDFLCFPRIAGAQKDITIGKARLLGYFLAEGSFLKYKGVPVEVQFNFSLDERETFADEVVKLLRQEFPDANDPWTQERDARNTCTVHCTGREMVSWFYRHGGEYSHKKRLSPQVLSWPLEAHKHLIGAWLNGDGHLHGIHDNTSGTTTSYDLACQMHLLLARCGWFARMGVQIGTKQVEIRDVVNGGFTRDVETGRLPAFKLTIGKTQSVEMAPYTSKAAHDSAYMSQGVRVMDDMVVFPITSIDSDTYDGWVHNMEVEEDNSYVVEGVVSHNCVVDGTQCTKCGHWAADESEMCGHIKYAKGNTFFDSQGRQHRIAELCGHQTIDPTAGVQFIEASWVAAPAFTGAVLRNVLRPSEELAKRAQEILSTPPPEWSADAVQKAAAMDSHLASQAKIQGPSVARLVSPTHQRFTVAGIGSDDDLFLAGWMEDGEETEESEDAGEPEHPLKDLEDELAQHMMDRVKKRIREDMKQDVTDEALSESSTAPNDNLVSQASRIYLAGLGSLVKSASSDVALVNGIAVYNNQVGIRVPVPLYRAALKIGHYGQYQDTHKFVAACQQVLGRQPQLYEAKILMRLSKLLARRRSSGQTQLAVAKEERNE